MVKIINNINEIAGYLGVDLRDLIIEAYDFMRLVDPVDKNVLDSAELTCEQDEPANQEACYLRWERNEICVNCVSIKALKEKRPISKLEAVGSQIYIVHAVPLVTQNHRQVVLEVFKKVVDLTIVSQEIDLDFSSVSQLLSRVNEVIYKDKLTGAFNREYLDNNVPSLIEQGVRNGKPVSIIMLDLDDFKQVNDQYGHLAGDRVLAATVAEMMSKLRSTDKVIRYGGDEFLVVLPETGKAEAMTVAGRIGAGLAKNQDLLTHCRRVISCSMGVYTICDSENLEQVIDRADQAMYQAKQMGKNIAVHYSDIKA